MSPIRSYGRPRRTNESLRQLRLACRSADLRVVLVQRGRVRTSTRIALLLGYRPQQSGRRQTELHGLHLGGQCQLHQLSLEQLDKISGLTERLKILSRQNDNGALLVKCGGENQVRRGSGMMVTRDAIHRDEYREGESSETKLCVKPCDFKRPHRSIPVLALDQKI
jgi:hypothetical protein